MVYKSRKFYLSGALVLLCGFGSASLRAAVVIPSPANDILLSSNGGVADINGSTVDGGANYGGLPPANLDDGDRDGVYNNGSGVDGQGSIAHTAGNGANQEMGVTITTPALITTVDLFNRTDCCGFPVGPDRIDGNGTNPFTLNIFNGATLAYTHDYTYTESISLSGGTGSSASGMVIPIPGGALGNHVQIIQHNGDYMNLAELEAYTPEPASLSLLGLGALGLLTRRR